MDALAKTKEVNAALNIALAQIAKDHGLDALKTGKLTYSENGFTTTLTAVFSGGDTKDMAKLRRNAFTYGLNESVCNAVITYSKQQFKVIGMRNTKIVLEQGGKSFTAPIDAVVNSIKVYHPEHVITTKVSGK